MEDMTPEQIEELRDAFNLFDHDGNGCISQSELFTVMQRLRQKASTAEITAMISEVDLDENSPVPYSKYVMLVLRFQQHDNTIASLSAMFRACDEPQSGKVGESEIKHLLRMLGYQETSGEVQNMISRFDGDNDNKLNKSEFIKMMQSKFALTVSHDFDSLTATQHRDLFLGYNLMDRHKQSSISVENAKDILTALGFSCEQDTLNWAVKLVCPDSQRLVYKEFLSVLELCMQKKSEDSEMLAMFNAFDADHNGYIDATELQTTMASLGMQLSQSDVQQMMGEIGAQDTGRIYYQDFVKLMSGRIGRARHKKMTDSFIEDDSSSQQTSESLTSSSTKELEELRTSFNLFDINGDGHIESSEVKHVMAALGVLLTDEEVQDMIRSADLDGNGTIEFNEFSELMKNYNKRSTDSSLGTVTTLNSSPPTPNPSYPQITVDTPTTPSRDILREHFRLLDHDRDNYVTYKDLKSKVKEIGLHEKDLRASLKDAGLDTQKKFKFKDFSKIFCSEFQQTKNLLAKKKLSKSQIRALRLLFLLCDTSKSGKLKQSTVHSILCTLSLPVSSLTQFFYLVDRNGDGQVTFKQLVQLIEEYTLRQDPTRLRHNSGVGDLSALDLQLMFAAFDKDKNGYIDATELMRTMKELGMQLTSADVNQMLAEAGGHGRIYYEDFVNLMTSEVGHRPKKHSLLSALDAERSRTNSTSSLLPEDMLDPASLQVAFSLFDKNQDGNISLEEVEQVMKSVGFKVKKDKVKQMFNGADTDGNGLIDFSEFQNLISMYQRRRTASTCSATSDVSQEDNTRQVYAIFDRDGDGFISAEEIRLTMKDVGVVLTDDDVASMMLQAGTEPEGKIGFEEFCCIMQGQFRPIKSARYPSRTGSPASLSPLLHDTKPMPTSLKIDNQKPINKSTKSKTPVVNGSESSVCSSCGDELPPGCSVGPFNDRCPICSAMNRNIETFFENSNGTPESGKGRDHVRSAPLLRQVEREQQATNSTGNLRTVEIHQNGDDSLRPDVKESLIVAQKQEQIASLQQIPSETKKKEPTDTWKAFKVFDRDGSGYIDCEELRITLGELGVVLSKEEILHMMRVADMNGDGKIDYREFCRLMAGALCGYQKMAAELQDKKTAVEGAKAGPIYLGNGMVDFHEFLRMMSRSRGQSKGPKLSEEDEMRQAFKVFDIDGNGLIDANELRLTMRNLGENLSKQDVKAMIKAADKNGDGKIDYEEFIKMMYNK